MADFSFFSGAPSKRYSERRAGSHRPVSYTHLPHPARIINGIFPRLIHPVSVRSGSSSPLLLHPKQHSPDKSVNRRFPGLIFPIDQIQSLGQLYLPVMKFPEVFYIQFLSLIHIFVLPLSESGCTELSNNSQMDLSTLSTLST